MTLSGLLINFVSWLIVFLPVSFAEGRWAFLWYAASLWTYQALDALDGKQARRTGSSSPLGELFDHGIIMIYNDDDTPMITSIFTPLCYCSVYHCRL
jgi:hypothetical protein